MLQSIELEITIIEITTLKILYLYLFKKLTRTTVRPHPQPWNPALTAKNVEIREMKLESQNIMDESSNMQNYFKGSEQFFGQQGKSLIWWKIFIFQRQTTCNKL